MNKKLYFKELLAMTMSIWLKIEIKLCLMPMSNAIKFKLGIVRGQLSILQIKQLEVDF